MSSRPSNLVIDSTSPEYQGIVSYFLDRIAKVEHAAVELKEGHLSIDGTYFEFYSEGDGLRWSGPHLGSYGSAEPRNAIHVTRWGGKNNDQFFRNAAHVVLDHDDAKAIRIAMNYKMSLHEEWVLRLRSQQMAEEQAQRKAAEDELMEMVRNVVKAAED